MTAVGLATAATPMTTPTNQQIPSSNADLSSENVIQHDDEFPAIATSAEAASLNLTASSQDKMIGITTSGIGSSTSSGGKRFLDDELYRPVALRSPSRATSPSPITAIVASTTTNPQPMDTSVLIPRLIPRKHRTNGNILALPTAETDRTMLDETLKTSVKKVFESTDDGLLDEGKFIEVVEQCKVLRYALRPLFKQCLETRTARLVASRTDAQFISQQNQQNQQQQQNHQQQPHHLQRQQQLSAGAVSVKLGSKKLRILPELCQHDSVETLVQESIDSAIDMTTIERDPTDSSNNHQAMITETNATIAASAENVTKDGDEDDVQPMVTDSFAPIMNVNNISTKDEEENDEEEEEDDDERIPLGLLREQNGVSNASLNTLDDSGDSTMAVKQDDEPQQEEEAGSAMAISMSQGAGSSLESTLTNATGIKNQVDMVGMGTSITDVDTPISESEDPLPETRISFEDFWTRWSELVTSSNSLEKLSFNIFDIEHRGHILEQDLQCAVEDVVENHPGLDFLKPIEIFQRRYVETVLARIYYLKPRNTDVRMTFNDFQKLKLSDTFNSLENEDDINARRDVFSYKHFYVIYCKFWELDDDHNLLIDINSLQRYERNALIPRAVERVYHGYGMGKTSRSLMTYRDYVWFILASEDKGSPQGIEYWFRILDMDDDGVLSLHELEWFWEQQRMRMMEYSMSDPWSWNDFICALLDIINPQSPPVITVQDLKNCKSAALVISMLIDLRSYDGFLRKLDPAFRERERLLAGLQGWQRYAERAYEELSYEDKCAVEVVDCDILEDMGEIGHHYSPGATTSSPVGDDNDIEFSLESNCTRQILDTIVDEDP